MTKTTLTPAQAKKIGSVVESLRKQLKVKANDEATGKNLERFVDKYARFALKVRGTGPHSHGFNAEQRKAIRIAVNEALGIKAPAPAAKANGKSGKKGNSRRRSTSELAGSQQARAEQS